MSHSSRQLHHDLYILVKFCVWPESWIITVTPINPQTCLKLNQEKQMCEQSLHASNLRGPKVQVHSPANACTDAPQELHSLSGCAIPAICLLQGVRRLRASRAHGAAAYAWRWTLSLPRQSCAHTAVFHILCTDKGSRGHGVCALQCEGVQGPRSSGRH